MVWVLLCIALSNLGLGYYLGTMLLLPRVPHETVVVAKADSAQESALPAENIDSGDQCTFDNSSPTAVMPTAVAKNVAAASSGQCWNTSCTDIRQDITTLYDRIRYSFTANDKKLARMIVADLQKRIPLWQELLEQKLALNLAELARDPLAKVDCVAPELCLAQTETLQTNLALLDWSDSTESILKKLEREVEAVKHLLPAKC